jgi:hypothetical protein
MGTFGLLLLAVTHQHWEGYHSHSHHFHGHNCFAEPVWFAVGADWQSWFVVDASHCFAVGGSEIQPEYASWFGMPADLDKKDSAVFEMRHNIVQEQNIVKFSMDTCSKLIETFVNELNKNFMTELSMVTVAEPLAVTDDTGTDTEEEEVYIF